MIAAVGVVKGMLYVAGGANQTGPSRTVEYYNPSNRQWTYMADMKNDRQYAGTKHCSNKKLAL